MLLCPIFHWLQKPNTWLMRNLLAHWSARCNGAWPGPAP